MLLWSAGATDPSNRSTARSGRIPERQRRKRGGVADRSAAPRSERASTAGRRRARATIKPRVTARLIGVLLSASLRGVPDVRTLEEFYATVETAIPDLDERLQVFVEEYWRHRASTGRPRCVLDVGCGRLAILQRHIAAEDEYFACDLVEPLKPLPNFQSVNLNEDSLSDAFAGREFDVVFCGEVIEHVFSPDAVLADLKGLLRPDGVLILSTPNLGYWVNRLLLFVGISPLFVENSSNVKLGRRFRFLGQGNDTQGHIRLFTYRAVRDLLDLQGFELLRTRSVPVWSSPVDRLVCRVSRSLAPDNVYVARRR
jgi:SAM-dependent methyltransferase